MKRSGAREIGLKKGVCDFMGEPWTKRVVSREEVEDHCGLAASITEPVKVAAGTVPVCGDGFGRKM